MSLLGVGKRFNQRGHFRRICDIVFNTIIIFTYLFNDSCWGNFGETPNREQGYEVHNILYN